MPRKLTPVVEETVEAMKHVISVIGYTIIGNVP